jgi:hypothetical protein
VWSGTRVHVRSPVVRPGPLPPALPVSCPPIPTVYAPQPASPGPVVRPPRMPLALGARGIALCLPPGGPGGKPCGSNDRGCFLLTAMRAASCVTQHTARPQGAAPPCPLMPIRRRRPGRGPLTAAQQLALPLVRCAPKSPPGVRSPCALTDRRRRTARGSAFLGTGPARGLGYGRGCALLHCCADAPGTAVRWRARAALSRPWLPAVARSRAPPFRLRCREMAPPGGSAGGGRLGPDSGRGARPRERPKVARAPSARAASDSHLAAEGGRPRRVRRGLRRHLCACRIRPARLVAFLALPSRRLVYL